MLRQDVAFALRNLRTHPAFSAVAALTLALGIGANTAIFTVVDAVLLRPLPYPDAERLVKITGMALDESAGTANLSPPDFMDFERETRAFEGMGALGWVGSITLTGQGDAERLNGTRVSAGFFPTLRVQASIGRVFRRDEDAPGAPRVIVITDGLWRRRFGADPAIVGRTLMLDAAPHTVIGVLPPWFRHPEPDQARQPDLFVLFQWAPDEVSRSGRYIRAVGRLKPDRSLAEARAEMTGLAARLEREHPETNTDRSVRLERLFDDIVRDARPALLVLLGAVGFVLIIACANVANLLLARGLERQREMAVRAALGAGRPRLIRQLLTESVLLAAIGGLAGLLLAMVATRLLATAGAASLPRADEIGVDARVLLFTLVASIVTGGVFGLAPALHLSRFDLERVLRQSGGRGGSGRATRRTREALVAAEVALALVLLVGAGLLIRSFWNLQRVDPGFRSEHVLTLQLSLPLARYPEGDQIPFYQRLYEHVRSLPGVNAVGAVNILPLSANYSCDGFQIDARPVPAGRTSCTEARSASPGYFRAMGLPLIRGRLFTDRDTPGSPPVVVINEAMARRFWPNRDPIGQRITYNRGLDSDRLTGGPGSREIVGVVGNVAHLSLQEARVPMFYTPQPQAPSYHTMTLVLGSDRDAASLTNAVRAAVGQLDKDVPIYQVRTLDSLLARSVAEPRFRTLLLGLFAALAVVLALVGVAAVMAFMVGQRTQEIGVRIALGARPADVVRLIVAQGMKPVALGAAIGLAGAWAVGRTLSGLLFDVRPTDPMTFTIVAAGLLASALVASYIPARRAARVDPVDALRQT